MAVVTRCQDSPADGVSAGVIVQFGVTGAVVHSSLCVSWGQVAAEGVEGKCPLSFFPPVVLLQG